MIFLDAKYVSVLLNQSHPHFIRHSFPHILISSPSHWLHGPHFQDFFFNCIKHAFYRFKPGALLEDESESEDEDSKDPSNEKFKVIDFCGLTTLILFLTSSP